MRLKQICRFFPLSLLCVAAFTPLVSAQDKQPGAANDTLEQSAPPPSGLLNSEPTNTTEPNRAPGGVPSSDQPIQPIGPGLRTVPDAGWGTMPKNEQAPEANTINGDHLLGPTLQASFTPSIWNDNYKLGLGIGLGGRAPLHGKLEAGGEAQYTWFRNKTAEFKTVHEIGLRVFAVHPLPTETFFTVKLGGFVGTSRLRKKTLNEDAWHLTFGGIGEIQIPLKAPYGLLLSFSPGYALGDNSGGLFRLGIGMQYALGK